MKKLLVTTSILLPGASSVARRQSSFKVAFEACIVTGDIDDSKFVG